MKKVLLVVAILLLGLVKAEAAVSVEQTTEPDYIINSGYSEATAEEILIQKNRVAGKPAEPLQDMKYNRFVRFCRNVYGYLDPAQDTDERIHHDIHMSPSAKDL